MMYCVLLYGLLFVVVRMGFNLFECVFMLVLVCDVVWFDVCDVCVFVCVCVLYLLWITL